MNTFIHKLSLWQKRLGFWGVQNFNQLCRIFLGFCFHHKNLKQPVDSRKASCASLSWNVFSFLPNLPGLFFHSHHVALPNHSSSLLLQLISHWHIHEDYFSSSQYDITCSFLRGRRNWSTCRCFCLITEAASSSLTATQWAQLHLLTNMSVANFNPLSFWI